MRKAWTLGAGAGAIVGAALLLGGCEENLAKSKPITIPPYSAAGTLDTSFGGGAGFIIHPSAAGGVGDDQGFAVALDGNGKIVVAGSSVKAGGNALLTVWRFNPGGSPDVTFGGTGFVTHANVAGGVFQDGGFAVKIDGNGKIVVAGRRWNGADYDLIVLRLHPNGAFDPALGGVGFLLRDTSGANLDEGHALAIDGAGNIVVAGTSYGGGLQLNDIGVWRFDSAGSDDATFGVSGYRPFDFAGVDDAGAAIALDSLGNIVVAGTLNDTADDLQGVVRLLGTDGSLDPAFFGIGFNTSPLLGATPVDQNRGNALAIDGSGRIVVAGQAMDGGGNLYMVVWRWLANGTLDTGFNGTGYKSLANLGGALGEIANAVTLDGQGRILLAGYATGATKIMALVRLSSNGAPDASFGTAGVVTHNGAAGGAGDDRANAVLVDSSGKILVVGASFNSGGNLDLAVWKYQ
jgi:uncharacterized delta-60 repeat protein